MRRTLRLLLATILLALATAFALEITILDVGQGTSVLIHAPSSHTALVDAGPNTSNTAQQLRAMGVTQLGIVIATHNDADHIGGMADVLTAFPPTYYIDNGLPHTTRTYERTLRAAHAAGVTLLEPERRNIALGDVTLTILPPTGDPSLGQNNNSVGVLVSYGSFRAFLPGDAEGEQWEWWLTHHYDLIPTVNVHVASHHGSRNGDTNAGINRLQPDMVIISLGRENQYGHPHDHALRLYAGATVLRTDQYGTITIKADPTGQYRADTQADATATDPNR